MPANARGDGQTREAFGQQLKRTVSTLNIRNGQSGRRGRRNRGGQQGGGVSRPLEQGNRNDARVRGNAHQLLEKYKGLARDAAAAGDRILSEYYMQYADHYYRVLAEHRSRFEDQRPRDTNNDSDDEAPLPAAGFGAAAAVQAFGVDGPRSSEPDAEDEAEAETGNEPQAEVEAAVEEDDSQATRRRRGRRPRRAAASEAPADDAASEG